MVKMMITIINYHHHHCSHGVFIPLCCYSPSTCTCTSFVQCQWLPLTLTTPKYFCVVVLPRTFHILQGCISCNKNFSWYWTVFPLTSKGPTLLLCCSFHGVKKTGNVHELALSTPHQFVQSKCCLQTYPSCILNVPEIEKLHFPKLGLVFLWDCER